MTTSVPPKWQPHSVPNYDSTMLKLCSEVFEKIISDRGTRLALLSDPRSMHHHLFADFAPKGYEEYAGTYRGTPNTSLVERESYAQSQINPSKNYQFVTSNEVKSRMDKLISTTQGFLSDKPDDDYGALLALSFQFCWFGKIHPFLDGNGHIQRAMFAALATEMNYPLTDRFAIHPRPYDRLFALALEIFTRAEDSDLMGELPLVAEYLAFYLGGPFDAVRMNVGSHELTS